MSKKKKQTKARSQKLFSALPILCSYSQSHYIVPEIKRLMDVGLTDEEIIASIPKSEAYRKEVENKKAAEEKAAIAAERKAVNAARTALAKEICSQFKPGEPYSKLIRNAVNTLCNRGLNHEEVISHVEITKYFRKRELYFQQLRAQRLEKGLRVAEMPRNLRLMAWGRIRVRVKYVPSMPIRDLLNRMDAKFSQLVSNALQVQGKWVKDQKAAAQREKQKEQARQLAAEKEHMRLKREADAIAERKRRLDHEADMEEAREYVQSIVPPERLMDFRRSVVQTGFPVTPMNLMEAAVAFMASLEPTPAPDPEPEIEVVSEPLVATQPAPSKRDDIELVGDIHERTMRQRDAGKQKAFKELLIENFDGRCAITGKRLNGVLEAAHIEHGIRNNASNGILMAPTFHKLFDRHEMGIDPETMTVHFKPGIECEEYEGTVITPLVYQLDKTRLAARWEQFKGNKGS
ncbi:HNH endonuclease [Klebsiella michiganensis]|uniref:HNH endonuclease n=1 Tax=Klebsiella michiganensis TaxID=1134687 RepID=UPI0039BF67D9